VEAEALPDSIYATPLEIEDLSECAFYHAMDLPGYGFVDGPWDLRAGVDSYLGSVDFDGKRVLELGTADGYLSFHIEHCGGEVISHDLSERDRWDVVPYARAYSSAANAGAQGREGQPGEWIPSWVSDSTADQKATMRRLNNAYWLAHRAFQSRARLVHKDIYSVPSAIGPVDVAVFGAILLHTRDPFLALAHNLQLTRETVIVTDALGFFRLPTPLRWARSLLPRQLRRPIMRFFPDWRTGSGMDGWWRLTPEVVQAFIGVLGFERSRVTSHLQPYHGHLKRLFTVVGHRTVPAPSLDVRGAAD
jgi:hypothetical protein